MSFKGKTHTHTHTHSIVYWNLLCSRKPRA